MYNVNGFLSLGLRRGRRQMLDLRAPEDRLLDDEPSHGVRRSRAVGNWIDAYYAADDDDDDDGRAAALRGVIDANRADMASGGVPVFAHPALPEDFADELARGSSGASIANLLKRFDPSVRQGVAQQLMVQAHGNPAAGTITGDSRFAVMGGDGEEGGAPSGPPRGAKPPPPGGKTSPVAPRPHPQQEQREKDRRAAHATQCERDYNDLVQNQKSIEFYYEEGKQLKAELSDLEILRGDLAWRRRRTEEDLREARSRSTNSFWHLECAPHSIMPRRWKKSIGRDIFCEIVKEGIAEKLEEQDRRRLEQQKERDIQRLDAQLSDLDHRIDQNKVDIDNKKLDIKINDQRMGDLGVGEKRIRDQYNGRGCRKAAPDWGA